MLVITIELCHSINFIFESDQRATFLKFLYGIEYIVTERLGHTLYELTHLLHGIELIVDIEEEIWILEEGEVLGAETLFEVGHEV